MAELRLSVVVPVLNEAAALPGLLGSLQGLRRRGAEIIVVDGGSDDHSATVARALADHVLSATRGRARQMNAGAAVARGEWLWFVHADSVLPRDIERWLMSLQAPAQWGFFHVRLDGEAPLLRAVARGMNLRSRLTRVATGDQGLFVHRDVFAEVGGFPNIALMEDVALSKLLRRRCPPQIWPSPITTSSRRWQAQGVLRTIVHMWWLRLLYFIGVSPAALVRRYYGR